MAARAGSSARQLAVPAGGRAGCGLVSGVASYSDRGGAVAERRGRRGGSGTGHGVERGECRGQAEMDTGDARRRTQTAGISATPPTLETRPRPSSDPSWNPEWCSHHHTLTEGSVVGLTQAGISIVGTAICSSFPIMRHKSKPVSLSG